LLTEFTDQLSDDVVPKLVMLCQLIGDAATNQRLDLGKRRR